MNSVHIVCIYCVYIVHILGIYCAYIVYIHCDSYCRPVNSL
jgi:hypothetical protein